MWVLGQIRDNLWSLFQVGPSDLGVKLLVNYHSLVGGGLGETKLEVWDPLIWSQSTTKVGGVTGFSVHRGGLCPATYFWGVWGPAKKSQKYKQVRILKLSW